ncbi:hypothetical protein DFH28DRAFT_893345 [Melampsora americana]|nr:hypothetical protein DFH28DRAFT_893345 [Melampsora americana]
MTRDGFSLRTDLCLSCGWPWIEARSACYKLKTAETRLIKARTQLHILEATDVRFTREYFLAQWERQRTAQAEIIGDDSFQRLQTQLGRLIKLEEDFQDAHDELKKLRHKRRRNMTPEEHKALQNLPNTLVALEESIVELADDLGGEDFRNMPEVRDPRARLLLRVRVAKEKLHEAKVGKIEWQKRWDQPGIGTTDQGRYKRIMDKRNKALGQKCATYKSNVETYCHEYPDAPAQPLPTFEEVKALDIADTFWNIGHLTHPKGPWAVDVATQTGIQAFRTARSCEEELERIACEVQQMMRWGLQMEEKLSALLALSQIEWVDGGPDDRRPLQWIIHNGLVSGSTWKTSQTVLKGLHRQLTMKYCRTLMVWNSHLPLLLQRTSQFSSETAQSLLILGLEWDALIVRLSGVWERFVQGGMVAAQQLDEFEIIEHNLLFGDEDIGNDIIDGEEFEDLADDM